MKATTHPDIATDADVDLVLDILRSGRPVGILAGAITACGNPFPVLYNCSEGCCETSLDDIAALRAWCIGQPWWTWEEAT